MVTRKDVIMGKSEKWEGMTGVKGRIGNKKWKKTRLGSHIRSTQGQWRGERRVWKHDERHLHLFKEYDKKNSDNIIMMGDFNCK